MFLDIAIQGADADSFSAHHYGRTRHRYVEQGPIFAAALGFEGDFLAFLDGLLDPIALRCAIVGDNQGIQRTSTRLFQGEAEHAFELRIETGHLMTGIQNGDGFGGAFHQLVEISFLYNRIVLVPGRRPLLNQVPRGAHGRRRTAAQRFFQIFRAHETGGLSGLGDLITHAIFPSQETGVQILESACPGQKLPR